ncbi:MAG: 4Fe-4S dicluster domain-containing protein [Deltaproteobacteria bacterium]
MKITLKKEDLESPLISQIERISAEDLQKCYQCGNCTGGCPVSFAMEIPPHQTMRMLQIGRTADVLAANSMWLCVGCMQCFSRCPKGCSVANVFEALRQLSLSKGVDAQRIEAMSVEFLKKAPQQAIVCGFRKFVG